MKYYRAITHQEPSETFIGKYGKQNDNRYIIICKANSLTDANKIATEVGLTDRKRVFNTTLTIYGTDGFDVGVCDKLGGFIVATDGVVGESFASIQEFIHE